MEATNEQRFKDVQADIAGTNDALGNIATEVEGLKTKVTDLERQVGEMGLTKEQEDVIFAGLKGIRGNAEAISSVVEVPEPTTEEPAEEPSDEEPAPGDENPAPGGEEPTA